MKTYMAKDSEMNKKWYVIDASGEVLGRLSVFIANILRGKNKPIFTPHVDTGDFVVVINAEKVKLTGKKLKQKIDFRYSGYPGGDKYTTYDVMMKKFPEKVIRLAVQGMLPHNRLSETVITKLKVYRGQEHPHQAQNPELIKMNEIR